MTVLAIVSANLLVWVISAVSIFESRQQYELQAQKSTQNIAQATSKDLNHAFHAMDIALRWMADETRAQWSAQRHPAPLDLVRVHQYRSLLPRGITAELVDATGHSMESDAVQRAAPDLGIADALGHHRAHHDDAMHLSRLIKASAGNRHVLIASRAILRPDGSLGALAIASIPTEALQDLLKDYDVGAHGSVALRHLNYELITRYPVIEGQAAGKPGNVLISSEARRLLDQGQTWGTFHTNNASDNTARTITFHRIDAVLLVVSAGLASSDYLVDWYDDLLAGLAVAVAFLLVSVLLTQSLLKTLQQADQRAQALQESEQFKQLVLQSVRAHVVVVDSQGLVQLFNSVSEQYAQEHSQPGASGLGSPGLKSSYFDLCAQRAVPVPADTRVVTEGIRTVLAGQQQEFRLEFCDQGKGSEVWFQVSVAPLSNAGDTGAVITHINITDRVQQQLQVRASEEKLRGLYEMAPLAIVQSDFSGRFIDFNQAFCDITGYERPELLSLQYWQLSPKEYKNSDLAQLAALTETGRYGPYEKDYIRKDGSRIAVSINGVKIRGSDGVDYVWSILEDITERRAEDARRELAGRVFEIAGSGLLVTDADNRIVQVNPALSQITGYEAGELIGSNPKVLSSGKHSAEFYRSLWLTLNEKGRWSGEVWNRRKNGDTYPQWVELSTIADAHGKVRYHVASYVDLSEIRRIQESAEQLATRDSLTHLANRAAFVQACEQALIHSQRQNRPNGAVLLLGLDQFAAINAARGIAFGDILLRTVAERLMQTLPPDVVVARLGGDEFSVLLNELTGDEDVIAAETLRQARALQAAVREDMMVGNQLVQLDCTLGITLLTGTSSDTVPDLLRQVHLAMRAGKDSGGSCIVFFDATMGDVARESYDIQRELKTALLKDELRLYLQPQVNAQGVQVGAEALVRWQHPKRGLLTPDAFIPIAETSELIVELGHWMLDQVCQLLATTRLPEEIGSISVNISARHFQKVDFVQQIQEHLRASGAMPQRLMLEITESVLAEDLDSVIQQMSDLTQMGVRISLDDFGTGYSSLSYLKRLPIHELKVDKSFVQDIEVDPQDASLVAAIVAVAQQMNLEVVAEGVETQAQARFLTHCGELKLQGYLYAKPLSVQAWFGQCTQVLGTPSLSLIRAPNEAA